MIFKYDPGRARSDFERNGYVHLRDILDDAFVSYLHERHGECHRGEVEDIRSSRIPGKKKQYLFDFPSRQCATEFRDGMAALTGIEKDRFTVSERHLYIYEPEAAPWPPPHKDRAASHVSIGLPILSPPGSTACVFPHFRFGPNREEKAIYLGDRDSTDPNGAYHSEHAIMLNERPGDIVAFLGSSLFHARVRAGGTAILYIKANGVGHDPLNEDLFADDRPGVPSDPRHASPMLQPILRE